MTNRQVALLVAVLFVIAQRVAGGPWPNGGILLENAKTFLDWLDR